MVLDPVDASGNQSCARSERPPGISGPCLEGVQEEVELLSRYNSGAGLYSKCSQPQGLDCQSRCLCID